jgi:hypothetical protein
LTKEGGRGRKKNKNTKKKKEIRRKPDLVGAYLRSRELKRTDERRVLKLPEVPDTRTKKETKRHIIESRTTAMDTILMMTFAVQCFAVFLSLVVPSFPASIYLLDDPFR